MKNGVSLAKEGFNNIVDGLGGAIDSIKNIGNPYGRRYRNRPRIKNYDNDRL